MPILPLVFAPADILRRKLAAVSDAADAVTQALVRDMRRTMVAAQGIGLAANQVGKDCLIFAVDAALAREVGVPDVFINPTLESVAERTAVMEEGCLSLPGKFAAVRRPRWVSVRAFDERGRQFRVRAEGLLARVIQHELDHLGGMLFTDRI